MSKKLVIDEAKCILVVYEKLKENHNSLQSNEKRVISYKALNLFITILY